MTKLGTKFLIAATFAATTAFSAGAAMATATQAQPVTKTIYVLADDMGLLGPDKQHHDSFLPSSFVLKAGQQVKLVFVNYDDMPHSFTAPGLHVNVIVKAATHKAGSDAVVPTETTYTFTPSKAGQFRWHCNFPCDKGDGAGWAMKASATGQDAVGYMAGYVVVM
ncbi:cupredoxin domain-containing protein [Solirhodobacter olei]|uniref:cupredoxin domain-containing protein n=1 Tax=Solirhodobacter olei TaxID=2493082 RepID=UPI000FD812CC|nr:cupredoxin domain-containing protein [Solirhodobacter olei]